MNDNQQHSTPEYGRLRSDYPENYDPYVYGKAEKPVHSGKAHNGKTVVFSTKSGVVNQKVHQPNDQQSFVEGQSMPLTPEMAESFLRGRFNAWSIFALILSFLLPIVGLFVSVMTLKSIKRFHMRGKAVAIIALVLSILFTCADVAIWYFGVDATITWLGSILGVDTSSLVGGISDVSNAGTHV